MSADQVFERTRKNEIKDGGKDIDGQAGDSLKRQDLLKTGTYSKRHLCRP